MPRFSLSTLGVDAPGIVRAVSGALADQGCNLEDSTMTVLQGHFAILMVITAPDGSSAESLESALGRAVTEFGLVVAVRPLAETAPGGSARSAEAESSEPLSIVVHGSDRPGIVHAIAESIAEHGANIVELSTQLVGDPGSDSVYVMTLRAVANPGTGVDLIDAVRETARGLGVQCTARPDDADVL